MKIRGTKVNAKSVEYIVIPRGDNDADSIVFKAQAVLDMEEFENAFPRPKPPFRTLPGGTTIAAVEDPEYQKNLETWARAHTDWMYLKSLEATEDLEWETVDQNKPETFCNWREELKAAGFTQSEILRIIMGIMTANGLNQQRIDEAQKSFLAGLREARVRLTSQSTEN